MSIEKGIIQDDCLNWLQKQTNIIIDLSFLDPPFNQGKN
jgi:16S rRNA G966 N2-methylase RsmD